MPKKGHNSGTVNVKYTVIELNPYLMVHNIVLKFEKVLVEPYFKYHPET
jgi:hypothetical protein